MDQRLREIERELNVGPVSGTVAWPLGAVHATDERPARDPAAPAEPEVEERADEIVAAAHAEAAQIVGDAADRVEAMGRRLEELESARDEIEASIRNLLEEHRRLAGLAAERSAVVPEPTLAPAREPEPDIHLVYKGDVAVSAGPFADIASLSEFERAMAGLRRVHAARVRGLEGDHAVLDITLAGPIRLVEEMRRGLPWAFEVAGADESAVSLRLTSD